MIASAAMFLLAGGLLGGLFYQQQQAQSDQARHIQQVVEFNESLEPTNAEVAGRITQFRRLRDKWRPWALQHKEELSRMLNAQLNDQDALMAVYNAIPADPHAVGITPEDMRSGAVRLGWQSGAKLWRNLKFRDPQAQERNNKDMRELEAQMQQDFATLRDIKISTSSNTGRLQTVFWASGRITEHKMIDNPKHGRGQPALVEAPPEEIELPYDFLKKD
jgi:hypothetical protein